MSKMSEDEVEKLIHDNPHLQKYLEEIEEKIFEGLKYAQSDLGVERIKKLKDLKRSKAEEFKKNSNAG